MLINAIHAVKSAFPNVKILGSENMLEIESADNNWQWFYHKQIGLMAASTVSPIATPEEALVTAYPNPLDNAPLTIDLSKSRGSGAEIQLTDLSGNVIGTFKAKGTQLVISREKLPGKGVYLLKVSAGGSVENIRLMIR